MTVQLLPSPRYAPDAPGGPGVPPPPGPGQPAPGQVPVPPPAPAYQQPAPGYQQPAPGYQQPAPGYEQPAPGYQQAPPGYQQAPPGYPQPVPGTPPPGQGGHRLSGLLIVGIVVVLLLLLGGGGATAYALFRPASQPSPQVPSPQPTVAQASPRATPSARATPSSEPSADASPDSGPPQTGGGTTIDTKTLSLSIPSGWKSESVKTTAITVSEGSKGVVSVVSGTLPSGVTPDAYASSIIKDAAKANAQATVCDGPAPATLPGKPTPPSGGQVFVLCLVTNSGVQLVDFYELTFASDNAGGGAVFVVEVISTKSQFNAFVTDAKPVVQSIRWKLLAQ